jgi:cytidylate kinase
MDKTAASVARLPKVRAVLVARQRGLGEQGGVVMEGRDIGTVVFPNAQLKIYLDADEAERAGVARTTRRTRQPGGAGRGAAAIQARDRSDKTRAASPLRGGGRRF